MESLEVECFRRRDYNELWCLVLVNESVSNTSILTMSQISAFLKRESCNNLFQINVLGGKWCNINVLGLFQRRAMQLVFIIKLKANRSNNSYERGAPCISLILTVFHI